MSYSFPRYLQARAEDRLAEQLRSQALTRRVVARVSREVNARGVPLLLVFVRAPSRAPIPPGIPSHFEGFRVVVKSSGDLVAQRPGDELVRAVERYQRAYCPRESGLGGGWLSKLVSDPISAIVSAPATAIDAAAGGPEKRKRTRAAAAAAAATQAQIDAEKAQRDTAVAAAAAAAQTDSAATLTTAKAAAKKKLIQTLSIGGGVFAVLAIGFLVATGGRKAA